jgi:hypothetical protein
VIRLLLAASRWEARRIAAMFAAMDIVSLRSPGCRKGSGDHLTEISPRSPGNGKAEQIPSPADVAGTPDGRGATGGITGD